MDTLWTGCIAACWAVFVAGIVGYIARAASSITYVTLADGRRQERMLPLLIRILLPLTPMLTPGFGLDTYEAQRKRISTRLTMAGFDGVLSAEEYLGLQVLFPAILAPFIILILAGLFQASGGKTDGSGARLVAFGLAILVWSALYLHLWLNKTIAQRHRQLTRALPFVIDLLTLSVEAGMDFMSALKSIIARRAPDALGEEFSRTLFEIQLGKTRRDALRAMADRTRQNDIQTMVTALTQADEMGVSIGAVLRIQSDQLRGRRFMRAEKLANEAPVKMLFPLVTCIFPSVFLILLGPIILQILRNGF